MRTLLRGTAVCKQFCRGEAPHTTLILFPDGKYLRALLKECAKSFFGAEEGTREAGLIENESFSDCVILPPEGGKLTAELAAAITDESLLRPVERDRKLFVLDQFQAVAPLVQNKLLKLLEEPPEGVYFLLGATSEHGVLPTVRSRAAVKTVPPFTESEIARALERGHAGAQGVGEAAAACGGVYSAAEELLAGREDFLLAEEFLSDRDTVRICRELGERKQKGVFFPALQLVLRDMLFLRAGQGGYAARTGERIKRLAAEYPEGAILSALDAVAAAEKEIQFNANIGQAAFTLALRIREAKKQWQKLS